MKKIISIFLFVAMILLLTSCNRSFIGTYNFTHVHICDNAGHTADYPIESWTEDGDGAPGIEVKIEGYGSMWLSEGTYILYTDKCPLCDK